MCVIQDFNLTLKAYGKTASQNVVLSQTNQFTCVTNDAGGIVNVITLDPAIQSTIYEGVVNNTFNYIGMNLQV